MKDVHDYYLLQHCSLADGKWKAQFMADNSVGGWGSGFGSRKYYRALKPSSCIKKGIGANSRASRL